MRKVPAGCCRIEGEPSTGYAEPLGDLDRRAGLGLADQDRLGADVGEVEVELVGAIGRVERRGGRGRGDRDEGRRHLRPVGEHDGDAVARADAERGQPGHGLARSAGAARHG